MDYKTLPVGPPAPPGEAVRPSNIPLIGKTTSVTPLQAAHAPALYKHLGGESNAWRWTHLPTGGFATYKPFETAIEAWSKSHDTFYAVLCSPSPRDTSTADPEAVGILAYVAAVPKFRRIEIGHVILGEPLKRSRQATEAFYLTLRHAFDDLGYTRVEWKANELNAPSLRAAERLGFSFDGVFRKHMIIKGRFRDTAWFGMTNDGWPGVKRGLETWLDESNFDETGQQKRRLEECRADGN